MENHKLASILGTRYGPELPSPGHVFIYFSSHVVIVLHARSCNYVLIEQYLQEQQIDDTETLPYFVTGAVAASRGDFQVTDAEESRWVLEKHGVYLNYSASRCSAT